MLHKLTDQERQERQRKWEEGEGPSCAPDLIRNWWKTREQLKLEWDSNACGRFLSNADLKVFHYFALTLSRAEDYLRDSIPEWETLCAQAAKESREGEQAEMAHQIQAESERRGLSRLEHSDDEDDERIEEDSQDSD